MSQRVENLWSDFLHGIRGRNEHEVKRILLETSNLNLGGGKSNFLTRKIHTTQGILTPLHLAVKHSAERIIKLLLESGVNVNITSQPHKVTALHMAIEQNKNGIIQLLLSHEDINVNATDEYGHTPLKLASEKGNQQTVKWLIEKGADITKADLVDNTAIHVAADKGHYGVLQLLLQVARNPGIIGKQNKDKNTPLHLAVGQECSKSVALLLCYGAAALMELENRHNETPKQLAKGNEVIMDLLKNPSKAKQHLMELTKEIGRGGSVEADSVMYVRTPQVTVENKYHAKVRDGGYAAIGPQSALHVGQSAVTNCVQPQLPSTGESSYSINMSGGHASIGDHSATNVGTATPRTPNTAESIESPFGFPESRSCTNPVTASSGNPTEKENISNTPKIPTAVPEVGSVGSSEQIAVATGSRGALSSSPVPETKNSGTPPRDSFDVTAPGKLLESVPEAGSAGSSEQIRVPTGSCVVLSSPVLETKNSGRPPGNSADVNVSEKLPVSVPEEGSLRSISEKENAVKGLGTLSHPVTESNQPRTPTGNSSDAADSPGRLPYPIPEQNKKPELGELEKAACSSRTETTATTERCTPLSGIGKKLSHRKASEESRATGDLQKQRTSRDELKTASASSAMQGPSVPLDILARGSLATEVYNRELKEGYGYARRVPIMIIGQARTGKTSLKKSLKGELFNPNEGSTEGIETDPSYFKVTKDVWRTGSNSEDTETELECLLDRQVAQNIAKGLKEEERLGDPSKSKTKPSVKDSKVVELSEANSPPTERSVECGSNRIEPSLQGSKVVENAKAPPLATEVSVEPEEPKTSSSLTEQSESDPSPQDSRDHQKVPENVAAWVEKLLKENKEFMEGDDMYSVIWDFGGQSVFYDTHPIFLTEKAIYILACNLSSDPDNKADTPLKQGRYKEIPDNYCENTNFDYLDFWMSSIYSLVSNNTNRQETSSSKTLPAVFLACTHADKPYTTEGNPSKEIFGALREKIYGSLLEDFFVVDNTKSGSSDECEGVKNLRQAVLSVAAELPQMRDPIPLKWLRYEKVLYLLMREEGLAKISIEDARKIASDKCGIDDDEIFRTVLDFLHNQKVLINFDESPGLERMVILNPQWLVDVFKEVITFKGFNHKDQSIQRLWSEFENYGILERKLLDHVWRRFNDDQDTYKSLIAIMERFNLLCRWPSEGTKEQYLVPSMLRSPPTHDVFELLASGRIPSLFVRFESCRVPPGLFSRLILLFHHWVQDKSKRPKIPKLFNNFALFHIFPHDATSVILLCHSSSIEIVFHVADVTRAEEEAFIHERYLNASRDIHRQLRLFLERMRNEFFWLKHMRYETCVSCPVCSQQTEGSKCRDHGVRSCDCLHLLSELELQEYPYCDRNVVCADCRIHKEMFAHWFAFSDVQESRIALTQSEDVTGRNQSRKNFAVSTRKTASERSASDPPEVVINQLRKLDLPQRGTHLDVGRLPVDILLLTVEDCEFLSCLSYLNPAFCKNFHRDLGYVYLGDLGKDERKLNVAVMNCYRGSASAGGSMVVVLNAVKVLRPKAVFCVGSCRSLDCNKVKLGDVVVLEKLITYGPCKITEGGIEERGVKAPLKSGLLKVILRASDGWQPPLKDLNAREVEIHRGAFLSGAEEVIDRKRCEALIERFPEVVAIEREGEGVFAAAHDLDIEWIVIKGISDYAGGSKSKETSWRPFASLMAASVTAHILSDAIIFQDWSHFESASVEKCRNCQSRIKRDGQLPWGRWCRETNIKLVFAGLVCLIAVVLFFYFGSN